MGRGGVREGARRGQADLSLDRLLGVPLVPRHGAGVVRGRRRSRAILNEHFVSIKVDREERPDVDSIYMQAVQMMTGHGGWPMSMFLTPDGAPFYAGTYFPPDDRHGMPGFRRVLDARRRGVSLAARTTSNAASAEVIARRSARRAVSAGGGDARRTTRSIARPRASRRATTRVNGGFGGAPKFPPSMTLDFLMQVAWRHERPRAATRSSSTR